MVNDIQARAIRVGDRIAFLGADLCPESRTKGLLTSTVTRIEDAEFGWLRLYVATGNNDSHILTSKMQRFVLANDEPTNLDNLSLQAIERATRSVRGRCVE